MRRSIISLYVLLTTRLPVPWTLLARGAVVVLAYVAARPFEAAMGLDALNFAVVAGLLAILVRKLPESLRGVEADAVVATIITALIMTLCAAALYTPAQVLTYAVSGGMALMGGFYALVLRLDPTMLDKLGWPSEFWGVEGQRNAVRWQILRCFGLATANAYAAHCLPLHEWIVSYAALPVVFYALFQWTVIATHPYEGDA